jgi:hypothetical protein
MLLPAIAVGAAALVAACDVGKQKDQKVVGPLVTVRESNVGPQAPLAANGVIRLRFDRYLLPSTVVRQSFFILDAENKDVAGAIVSYDPVSLVVTISPPATGPWVTPGQPYKLILPVPSETAAGFGLRAIDGATLDPSSMREFAFTASNVTLPPAATQEPSMSFCRDVFPVMQAKCASGSPCHGAPDPSSKPAGSLVLTLPNGFRQTAINRVAQGSNTSARPEIQPPGNVFGIDMPLIDPGSPGNSWLMYKVLLARLPTVVPTDGPDVCLGPGPLGKLELPASSNTSVVEADDFERHALNDYVLGREMPYPAPPDSVSYSTQALSYEERQRLRMWIAQGAIVQDCGACDSVKRQGLGPSDAGTD